MPYKNVEQRRQYMNNRSKLMREGKWVAKPQIRLGKLLICPECTKEFYRSPANRRQAVNYCSMECMGNAFNGRNIREKSPRWKGEDTKPCNNCGVLITRPKWTWKDRELTFCNPKCFGEWKENNWTGKDNPCWRGGHAPYYGSNWIRQQRETRKRDNHQCQLCDINETECRRALDVHHIVPFRCFGIEKYREANALSNLVSLCDSCHKYAEQLSQSGIITNWTTLKQAIFQSRQIQILEANQIYSSDFAEESLFQDF